MFKVTDIEDSYSVDDYIFRHCNRDVPLTDSIDALPEDKYAGSVFELELDFDLDAMVLSCKEAFDKFGWYGMANVWSPKLERSKSYGGLSLVYNHNYAFDLNDPHEHTLGYPRITLPNGFFDNMNLWTDMINAGVDKTFFAILNNEGYHAALAHLFENGVVSVDEATRLSTLDYVDGRVSCKNTYNDTYSFNRLTDAALYGEIGKITKKFKRTIVRSRLASLNRAKAEEEGATKSMMWHTDSSWFKEFRINISITNLKNVFYIQTEDEEGPVYSFEAGKSYVWDTGVPHVPYSTEVVDFDRINLIYAVSPWFDYNEEEDSWAPNEFFMKKHPVDMLLDGEIIDKSCIKKLKKL